MKIVKFFYDLETTGLDFRKHSIHQISGFVEVNEEIQSEFDFQVRPHPKALIEPEALKKCGVLENDILQYPKMEVIYKLIIKMLSHYIDKYDKTDKAFLVGFNNSKFDDIFFRAWFEQNKDKFFGSWFWSHSLDTMVLASQYLIERRQTMPSFKLHRVAMELGIDVDPSRFHDAMYDIVLTRRIYRIVTGIDFEL